MIFESDEYKAEINLQNHGVSFAEAEEIFDDLNGIEFFDEKHSDEENRFQRVGLSNKRLLFVIYTIRETDEEEIIRLISARKADNAEIEIYNKYNE